RADSPWFRVLARGCSSRRPDGDAGGRRQLRSGARRAVRTAALTAGPLRSVPHGRPPRPGGGPVIAARTGGARPPPPNRRRAWPGEQVAPVDALGTAGGYDRAAVARLYGALRPTVARGWIRRGGELESVTLVSPVPDPTATRLEPGTLIIRLIICCL